MSMHVTLSRIGDFTGPVVLTTEHVPDGMTALLENEQTTGQITTVTLRLHADSTARQGTFNMGLRGRADRLRDATLQMTIDIGSVLTYNLLITTPTVTIAKGGIGRSSATITRTNYVLPVTLTLGGATGISAIFDESPLAGTSTPFTIAVASTVPSGTYDVFVRGTGPGVTDRTVPMTVNVSGEPLQLLTGVSITAPQVSTRAAELIVNRATQVGAVTLSAENLPSGVTAVVHPLAPGAGSTTFTVAITAAALPGTSRITLRARAAGVPDATADIDLRVTEAGIEFKPVSTSLQLFQGTAIKSSVTIARTDYAGDVAFTADNVPVGLTVSVLPSSTTGDTVALDVSASADINAGTYTVALRAIPSALMPSAMRVAFVPVVVHPRSTSVGNVLLDWSKCETPEWVAGQDGSGPWLRLDPVAGTFRFTVTQPRGGFAYVATNAPLTVRYLSQAELTNRPIDMCPRDLTTKTVRGHANHPGSGPQWSYHLGGGSGFSTNTAPDFTISSVRPGVHDLVGWSQPGAGFRALLRRDLNIPDGESLTEPVDLLGPESVAVAREVLSIIGAVSGGESLTHSMAYLTRNACTASDLYASAPHGFAPNVYGIPALAQRADDFHLLTVVSSGITTYRSVSVSFHTLQPRTLTLPPVMNAPTMLVLPGPYKRLQASLGALSTVYNGTVELRYHDGARTVLVQASNGYLAGSTMTITTPDLSGVTGFPTANTISPSATVSWTVTVSGGDETASPCTENRTSVLARRLGSL
ncbi:MAG: hypothetical protein IPP90_14945 [Gemmatimonadaceae bacterium]|nr:hypothetical protein [Gemmatimonadaceae bacterium]